MVWLGARRRVREWSGMGWKPMSRGAIFTF